MQESKKSNSASCH